MLFILKYLILLVFIIFNFIYFKYNNNKGRAYCFLVSLTAKTDDKIMMDRCQTGLMIQCYRIAFSVGLDEKISK